MTAARAALALVLALVLSLTLHRIISVDLWIHLATGEWILAAKRVPRVDIWSFTAAGHEWVDLHWGYQLLVTLANRVAGAAGITILHAAPILAAVGIVLGGLARRSGAGFAVAAAGLLILTGQERVLCRPEAFTLLFLALTWRASERMLSGRRVHPAWLLLQVAWANMQGLFILGPALLLLRAAGAIGDARVGRAPSEGSIRRLVLAAAAMLLVSAIGPYHVEGALLPFRLAFQVAGASVYAPVLGELLSPFEGRVVPVLFALSLALAFGSWLADRDRRAADLVPALAFAVLAISARRNLLLFALVAMPLVVRGLDDLARRLPRRAVRAIDLSSFVALAIGIAAVIGGRLYYEVRSTKEPGVGFSAREYPVAATRHLSETAGGGRVFNMLGDGDYLTYHLGEEWSVAFDGRAEVYGEALGRELLRSYTDPATFRALAARYRIDAILMDVSSEVGRSFVSGRVADGEWRLRFLDARAAVLTPADRDGPSWTPPPQVDGDVPEARPLRPWVLRARFPFRDARYGRALAALGHADAAAAALGDAVRAFPHHADLFCDYGAALFQSGAFGRAARAFGEALRLDPDHDVAATGRARSLERTTGAADALAFLDPWCEAHPAAPRAWLARAAIRARSGDLRGAMGILDEARGRIPAATPPLAALLLAAGDTARAEEVLREHLAEMPEDPEARALLDRARDASRGEAR